MHFSGHTCIYYIYIRQKRKVLADLLAGSEWVKGNASKTKWKQHSLALMHDSL